MFYIVLYDGLFVPFVLSPRGFAKRKVEKNNNGARRENTLISVGAV
jgi:hypothetical protein